MHVPTARLAAPHPNRPSPSSPPVSPPQPSALSPVMAAGRSPRRYASLLTSSSARWAAQNWLTARPPWPSNTEKSEVLEAGSRSRAQMCASSCGGAMQCHAAAGPASRNGGRAHQPAARACATAAAAGKQARWQRREHPAAAHHGHSPALHGGQAISQVFPMPLLRLLRRKRCGGASAAPAWSVCTLQRRRQAHGWAAGCDPPRRQPPGPAAWLAAERWLQIRALHAAPSSAIRPIS